jgi:hypothetical protein
MIRWISFGLCILANLYFIVYELYIYYDMLNYPKAQIGDEQYEYYLIKYGSFLKNIRYEEFDVILILFSLNKTGLLNTGSDLTITTSYPTTRNS